MLLYLLKSGACLIIFYGFYKLLLEKESIHTFKRFYLLTSVALSFTIPFITFTEYIEVIPQNVPSFYPDIPITNTIIEAEPINYVPIVLWVIYGMGVLLFSIKFIKNLSQLLYRIKHNTKIKTDQYTNVLLQDLIVPHTFFDYIFLNKQKFETQQIPKEVLLHEATHAKQKHSLDVLFMEILQILFWFNPLIYFIKHSIKLNHEFLADQAVINNGVIPSTYQQILLAFSSNAAEPPLANAINYSSIKKRFTVMKTHTSKQAFWLRNLILLPLLAILIYSFSEKKVIEKPFVVQQNISANGVTETMMKEYRDFINDFESSNRIIYPNYLRAVAIYDLMTEEQRDSVKKYPEDIVSNLSNIKPRTPTETEFNSWKDSNKFAIWIDGKHVKNSELNNYKTSDIKYFANSFVHNNARNERFPQPYQNHLYTEKGFDTAFNNSEKDHSVLDQIKKELEQDKASNEIKVHISKDKKVTIGNETIDFNSLSTKLIELTKNSNENDIAKPSVIVEIDGDIDMRYIEDIKKEVEKAKLNILYFTTGFISFDENLYLSENIHVVDENGELVRGISHSGKVKFHQSQQKATTEEIAEYNTLIKKFNSLEEGERIIKVKDKNRIEYIYSLMTNEQKKENEAFPDFSTIAPPPKPYQENTSQDIVEEYKKKYNELEVLKKTSPHYIHKTETEQEKMNALFLDLNNMHIIMSNSNRQMVSRPEAPILPYTKLIRNGKIEYKKISELTEEDKKLLPPPPPPPVKKETDDHTKESLEARKKFWEKANTYGEAMQVYFKEKKGNLDDLKKQYKEVMELYNSYQKLLDKENVLPPPPPPPVKN